MGCSPKGEWPTPDARRLGKVVDPTESSRGKIPFFGHPFTLHFSPFFSPSHPFPFYPTLSTSLLPSRSSTRREGHRPQNRTLYLGISQFTVKFIGR